MPAPPSPKFKSLIMIIMMVKSAVSVDKPFQAVRKFLRPRLSVLSENQFWRIMKSQITSRETRFVAGIPGEFLASLPHGREQTSICHEPSGLNAAMKDESCGCSLYCKDPGILWSLQLAIHISTIQSRTVGRVAG